MQEENEKLKAMLANGGQITLDNLKIKKDDDDDDEDDDDDDDTSNMTDEGISYTPRVKNQLKDNKKICRFSGLGYCSDNFLIT